MKTIFQKTPYASVISILIIIFLLAAFIYKLHADNSTAAELKKLISENIKEPLTESELLEGADNGITRDNGWYYYIQANLTIMAQIKPDSDIIEQYQNKESFDLYNKRDFLHIPLDKHKTLHDKLKKNNTVLENIESLIKKGNETKISSYGYPGLNACKMINAEIFHNMGIIGESLNIFDGRRLDSIISYLNQYYNTKCQYLMESKDFSQTEQTLCDWIDFLNSKWSPEIKKDDRLSLSQLDPHYDSLNITIRKYLKENKKCDKKLLEKYKTLQTKFDEKTSEKYLSKAIELEVIFWINSWDYACGEKDITKVFPKATNAKDYFELHKVQKSDINRIKINYLKDLKSIKDKSETVTHESYGNKGTYNMPSNTYNCTERIKHVLERISDTKYSIKHITELLQSAEMEGSNK